MHHNWIRLVGISEIYGGISGLINAVHAIPAHFSIEALSPSLVAALVYSFSIIAGVWLLEVDYRGLISSKILQLIQIPLVTFHKINIWIASGIYINLLVSPAEHFQSGVSSLWTFQPSSIPMPVYGCNLVACLALCILFAANIVESEADDKTEKAKVPEKKPEPVTTEIKPAPVSN